MHSAFMYANTGAGKDRLKEWEDDEGALFLLLILVLIFLSMIWPILVLVYLSYLLSTWIQNHMKEEE